MTAPAAITLSGEKELGALLRALPEKVYNKVLGPAMTRAAKPVIAAARNSVSVETGALRKSLGSTLKKYRSKGIIVAVIGARAGFRSVDENGKSRNPAKYAHLVELGHRIVPPHALSAYRERYGKTHRNLRSLLSDTLSNGVVRPRPFLEPALRGRQSTVVQDLAAALRIGIEREAARGRKS